MGKKENTNEGVRLIEESRTLIGERLGPTLGVCLRDVSVMRGLAVEPSTSSSSF